MALTATTAILITGCATNRTIMSEQSTKTNVGLNSDNFKVVKPAAVGHSYGFRFLGIIPFASPNYAAARADLYKSVGDDVKGHPVTLANDMESKSTTYLILFSIPKLTLTADVIEFVKNGNSLSPQSAEVRR